MPKIIKFELTLITKIHPCDGHVHPKSRPKSKKSSLKEHSILGKASLKTSAVHPVTEFSGVPTPLSLQWVVA